MFDLGTVTSVFKIILFDLILSGDNAVVIGMAARRLTPRSRRRAIVLGGAGAIGLRVFFTGIAALVLDPHRGLPIVGIGGGSLLLWIAYKLLLPQEPDAHVTEAESLAEAVRTIILADVVMSLDNILAVGAAAAGHLWLLLFGLALSIPILLVGSNLVARLLGRVPLLVYVGALILVWTAVEMAMKDRLIHEQYAVRAWQILAVALVAALVIVFLAQRHSRSMLAEHPASHQEPAGEEVTGDAPPPVGASRTEASPSSPRSR
ncbi:MAG: tellurium resistance protein TerC [Chloroflexota bacterium]